MKSYLPIIAALFLVSTPLVLPATASKSEIVATDINPYIKDNIAREISVKITSADSGGSGVIIARNYNTYLVLTNKHVVQDGKEFTVDTHDGVTYQAIEVENKIATDDDLALLQFTSNKDYQTATINTAATPRVEQTILAVGYSAENGKLVTESGKIEKVPNKTLKEGYSIGYTSNIIGGMSGGAIINTDGEVIGINGKSAFPIVNTGYTYRDGTKPSAEEIEELRKLSWGLSINRLLARVDPEIITAYSLPLPKTAIGIKNPELTSWLGELEAKAKQITVRIDSSSGGNGSGVIVAKQGNTYTVLTAAHVVCQKDDSSSCIDYNYDIVAPDGKKYPVDLDRVKRQEGVDLAVVRFDSSEQYQIAELASYPINKSDAVFVAGYPKLSNNTPADWLFSLGKGQEREQGLLEVNDNSLSTDSSALIGAQGSLSGGYEMVYTSITYGGMSGGAVLDREGRVIGIHGLAEGETAIDSQNSSAKQIQLGKSLGVPIDTFIGLWNRFEIDSPLPVQDNRPRELNSAELESFNSTLLSAEIPEENATAETWLERGNQLLRLERYTEAVAAFDRATALNPEFVHLAHYGKSLALSYDDQIEAALVSLELATEIEPNFAPAFDRQCTLLGSLGRSEEALAAIEKAISLLPDNANYHSEKGVYLLELKRYEEAETAFDRAISLVPRSLFYYNRGVLYQQGKKPDLALSDYSQAIAVNPNYVKPYNNRGLIYQQDGKLAEALFDYDRAIAIDPKLAEAYYNRGIAYYFQGKLTEALSDYNRSLEINPNYAQVYSNRGNVYQDRGKLDLALSDYEKSLDLDPQSAVTYYNRGILYYNQGKLDLALSDYSQAIAINPNYAQVYSNRGNVYADRGQLDLALSDYNRAIQINPNSAEAYDNRGMVYANRGQLDLALSDYNQAIQIDPNFANAYNNRAIVYYSQRKLDLALSDYSQAIKVNPNDAKAYVNRGILYREEKKLKLALSDFNRALKVNPNLADAYVYLGIMHVEQKDFENARFNLEKAQQLLTAQSDTAAAQKIEAFLQELAKQENHNQ